MIVSAVAKKKRESTKMIHNTAVGTEAMRQWGKVSQSIRARIGEATWKTFVAPIRLESVNGEGITIRASAAVAKELRSTDLAASIAKLWAEESGQATTVQILEQS
jgi:chromosomal replication initiation ATPase DnaA